MRIIIDADACPSINLIENLAKTYNIELILVSDNTHNLHSDYANIIIVDKTFGSADIKIMNIVLENDIVVTQDYGVAVVCLSKHARVINPKGFIYNDKNMDTLLNIRQINSKLRKSKIHTKGPKKRTNEDDIRLINNLKFMINDS